MKFWQCCECRMMSEDCNQQCYLISDNDIIPTNCVRDKYIYPDGAAWYEDVDGEDVYFEKAPEPVTILYAKWDELTQDDIKYSIGGKIKEWGVDM